jgi:hypothetical protein
MMKMFGDTEKSGIAPLSVEGKGPSTVPAEYVFLAFGFEPEEEAFPEDVFVVTSEANDGHRC